MDLGADELTTFRKVTFPLILPGVLAARPAGILPLDRRLHHHQLRIGHDQYVPILALQHHQNALPVQINVVGSMIFLGCGPPASATPGKPAARRLPGHGPGQDESMVEIASQPEASAGAGQGNCWPDHSVYLRPSGSRITRLRSSGAEAAC